MRVRMNKRLKCIFKQLQHYSPIIGLISIILSISFFTISYIGTQRLLKLEESWRDAVSRAWGDILRGGNAYPFKTIDKWAVNFERESTLTIHIQASVDVVIIRHNSTIEPK